MNYLTLQNRANQIVENVNTYEANFAVNVIDETETLAAHKYVDLFSLRTVLKWIYTATASETLPNKNGIRDYFFAVGGNEAKRTSDFFMFEFSDFYTSTGIVNYNDLGWTAPTQGHKSEDTGTTCDFLFEPENNSYCFNFSETEASYYRYDYYSNKWSTSYGFQSVEGAYLDDAIITEGSVQNLQVMSWCSYLEKQTFDGTRRPGMFMMVPNQFMANPRRCFNGFTQGPNVAAGCYIYGVPYRTNKATSQNCVDIPNTSYRFKVIVPQTFSIGDDIVKKNPYQDYAICRYNSPIPREKPYGSTYVNAAPINIYFELCFKRRRAGCKALGLDFVPGLSTVADNDPQGFAARLALGSLKPYFDQTDVWWQDLTPYYSSNNRMQTALADLIVEKTKTMTDTEYLNNYKLDYETYAQVTGDPL